MPENTTALPNHATPALLSNIFKRDKVTIFRHIHRAGLQPDSEGRYPVKRIAELLIEAQSRDPKRIAIQDYRLEKQKKEAELLTLKVAELEGRLVDVDYVKEYYSTVFTSIRETIIGSRLEKSEQRKLLRQIQEHILPTQEPEEKSGKPSRKTRGKS